MFLNLLNLLKKIKLIINIKKIKVMSARIARAIIGCTRKQPKNVLDTANNVVEKMYDNNDIYTTPPRTKTVLSGFIQTAAASEAAAKNRGKLEIETRDQDIGFLFDVLQDEYVPYVNGLYKGNPVKLLLSGLPISSDPVPHGIPETPVIKRVDNGPEPHSAKIFLAKTTSPLKKQREKLTYCVYMSTDPSMLPESFRLVLTTTSQRKLIVKGLTRGSEVAFAVTSRNSAGVSKMSDAAKFIPN